MNDSQHADATVVVGIDGSGPALHAAHRAIDEALSRDLPLRLVYVTATHLSAPQYRDEICHAKSALHAAQTALTAASGPPLRIETAIVNGPPAPALIEQSRSAALICVGSVGIGRYARSVLGSTATELADRAACPVAIIGPAEHPVPNGTGWIVAALTGEPDQDMVIEHALAEATLRHAAVLAVAERCDSTEAAAGLSPAELDGEVQRWRTRYPDVHLYPIAVRSDVAHFLANHDEQVQLTVIGPADTGELIDILGRYQHSRSSVLVVRH